MSSVDINVTAVPHTNPATVSYELLVPENYGAVLYGSVTAGWTQRVIAKLYNGNHTDPNSLLVGYTFEGSGNKLLPLYSMEGPITFPSPGVALGGVLSFFSEDSKTYTATIEPATQPRKLVLEFAAQRPGQSFVDSKTQFKKNKIANYAINFTFYTEDGFDGDNHDTTFSVGFVATKKP